MRARAQAGFDVLRSNPMVDTSRIATVGYCFGGEVAVEFAETGAPIVGSVAIHGSFRGYPAEAAKNIHGPVPHPARAENPVAPLSEVIALIGQLRAAKVAFELNFTAAPSTASRRRKTPTKNAPTTNQGGCGAVLQAGVRAVTACRRARGINTSQSAAAPRD